MFERERVGTQTVETKGMGVFLSKGTRLTGKLVCEGPGRLEGQIDGEVCAKDALVVGESAVVNAQIEGVSVVVHGQVTGDIKTSKMLEIRAPSRVRGNISAPSLVIHEGAVFEGHCSMGSAESPRPEKERGTATQQIVASVRRTS